jgi:hypothetical protein
MPQLHLPMFPHGVIHITEQLAVIKKDGAVTYFNGHMPAFSHGENDIYHKYPGEDWAEDEFFKTEVRLAAGGLTTIELGERGTQLSNGLWVREFRKRNASDHQKAFLATDYQGAGAVLAPAMFSRWSQENFFRYMRCRLRPRGPASVCRDQRRRNPFSRHRPVPDLPIGVGH